VFVKEENTDFIYLDNISNITSVYGKSNHKFDVGVIERLNIGLLNKSPRILYEVNNEIASADSKNNFQQFTSKSYQVLLDWRADNIYPIFKKGI